MFLTAPNIWLQSWESPALTRTMEVISWFGYTRTAIAIAVLVAFAYHLRAGMALLILLGLNSVAIDVAKTTAALPRPFVVDPTVRVLGWPAPETTARAGELVNATDSEAGFGFPSGHVSTAVTFVAGLAGLTGLAGRHWVRVAGLAWISLMAVSRLYLGRHFVGDVLGGLVLGAVIVGLGMTALHLSVLCRSTATRDVARAALISALVAAVLLATSLIAGRPDLGDTGRLAGMAMAVLFLARSDMVHLPGRPLTRAALVVLAACSYGVVWASMTYGLQPSQLPVAAHRLARSALPAFAMLAVPAVVACRRRPAAMPRRDA